ncbi:MAG TPA: iron-sulfur cluster assembly accessory protein [Alphaproteobacteria bacterium]|nr:iron-sulfur cluster assembly accessory protein [Alphaproteobacteria bacterium]HOO50031.1 iron-sulfur cluster assembly accessory protein [Alphaproteobacteria bacterium]
MDQAEHQISVSPTAYNRIEDVRADKGVTSLYLRVAVSGGGCSGFRYDLSWEESPAEDDVILDDVVVVDSVSASMLQGATVDYLTGLMGEHFKIVNPNATSGCGCGESFSM